MTNSVRLMPSAAAIFVAASLFAGSAAADMPAIKVSDSNTVASCATPGRLMTFLKERNPNLLDKFDTIAAAYKQAGEELGVRWDYAFFQMLVETGFLSYKGTVKPDQNNFAGIGATGGGVRGESFKDVVTGARAHLEHLAMYAGDKLENPTAERTRLVMEQGVLTKWQSTISGPMTFTDLTKKWAPTSKGYAKDIQNVADRFFDGSCSKQDQTVEAKAPVSSAPAAPKMAAVDVPAAEVAPTVEPTAVEAEPTIGDKLAKKANDDGRADEGVKSGLGAAQMAEVAETQQPMPVKILNAPAAPVVEAPAETAAVTPKAPVAEPQPDASKPGLLASLSAFGKSIMNPTAKATEPPVTQAPDEPASDVKASKPAAASGKCRVFTASYGGGKSVIIKAVADKQINYTVLDVNEGAEKREAEAYIAAYAKGGETVGNDYKSQDQALDKAFELCPEG